MTKPYELLTSLTDQVEMPADGTLSRTIHQDGRLKVVIFAFSAGQELSEHTASTPAIMHFLSGDADVTLGNEKASVSAGTWIHMAPQLPHSIRTKTPVVMLLSLLKGGS